MCPPILSDFPADTRPEAKTSPVMNNNRKPELGNVSPELELEPKVTGSSPVARCCTDEGDHEP